MQIAQAQVAAAQRAYDNQAEQVQEADEADEADEVMRVIPMPLWPGMTPTERRITLNAMQRFGGGFVQHLARAWLLADEINAAKLGCVFNDYMRAYGPQSWPYRATEAQQ